MRYRHIKRGTTYRVLFEAAPLDGVPMVVYQAEHDGQVWVRPASEFFDGRFSPLTEDNE